MGVQNLWKALAKGDAVQQLDGSRPGEHAAIVQAVEHKVVAVDLSAWLMQAQTQPALQQHYDSPFACALKVVFDRVRAVRLWLWAGQRWREVEHREDQAVQWRRVGVSVCRLADLLAYAMCVCADHPLAAIWLPASVCHRGADAGSQA